MIVQKYCKGDGLFAGKPFEGNHRWLYSASPNNMYRPISVVPAEKAEYVCVQQGLFGSTKYDAILLKEWFYAVKVGGVIILPINGPEEKEKVDSRLSNFFPSGALKVVKRYEESQGEVVIIRKCLPALNPKDDISRWSFGIITNGKRIAEVEAIIKSIREQSIPDYEIIVCGKYFNRKEPDFRYIEFTENDDKGWITKKKNLVCEAAKYENLAVVHDRVLFLRGWYKGFQRFGNYFDAMSCIQCLWTGFRTWDWVTYSVPFGSANYHCVGLHYDDWDPFVFMDGGLTILKRSMWEREPWDENRFWEQEEDVDISHRISASGGIIRFNPYSRCRTMTWRHNVLPLTNRDDQKLGHVRHFDIPSRLYPYFTRLQKKLKDWLKTSKYLG